MSLVLVVDDDPAQRRLLRALLDASGHQVIEAGSGEDTLRLLETQTPDVIILDVMMPGMDGLELLQRIKDRVAESFIPVVVLTGATNQKLKERAMIIGASDFLTKPCDKSELLRSLGVLLDPKQHRKKLAALYKELLVVQTHRDNLINLLIHDFKGQLSVIGPNLSYAIDLLDDVTDRDVKEALADAMIGANTIQRMVFNLLDVGRAESGRIHPERSNFSTAELFAEIARGRTRRYADKEPNIEWSGDLQLYADRDVIRRVLENLVENALRYIAQRGRIAMRARAETGRSIVEVANTGPSIPLVHRSLIFDKYAQLGRRSGSAHLDLGLGLYFCRLALEAHGGSIRVEETSEFPTVFVLELPQ